MRRAFSAAAASYDEGAGAQQEVASRVAALVLEAPPAAGARILEIGCGTGLLTKRLVSALPDRRFWVTDLSPAMLERCREQVGEAEGRIFRVMDGEWPDLEEGGFDLVVSSFAFQWFDDLGAGLARLSACLRPGGRMVFSIPGAETFHEWRRFLRSEGIPSGIGRFPSRHELARMATVVAEEQLEARFDGGLAFVRHLEAIGARVAEEGYRPMPSGALRRLLRSFDGRVSYHVLIGELVAGR
ncbi:Biotin synthesis protein BioC [Vulgatibacter incomptus]|uniref:Biotin synthesis protein BioC n=1 Tax=Vulgatibacter incomptus TaxID=1391653 RepID=A0A0K1PER8_9BACT|nr:Biotin synthesis protein BioC [Vulgatibacter incomptus]